MKEKELLQLIADNMSSNTMDNMFPYIAADCEYYSSGKKRASGKEDVCAFFMTRKNAHNREKVACFGFYATISESTIDSLAEGTDCVAVCQFDRYNCVGFMTIQTNTAGEIKEIAFNTTPAVTFSIAEPGKWNVTHVPSDAKDAISYRAFAFGIMDEHVVPTRHIQRYDVFQDYVGRVDAYIRRNLFTDFGKGIQNAGGYLYISAMAAAVQRKKDISLFVFDEKASVSGKVPAVDPDYQDWINEGYETGKKLFFGFNEYAALRNPEEAIFAEQLLQSFMDMTLYGSVQANKDMDTGKIVFDKNN